MRAAWINRSASDPVGRIALFSAVAHFYENTFQTCRFGSVGRSDFGFFFASPRIPLPCGDVLRSPCEGTRFVWFDHG